MSTDRADRDSRLRQRTRERYGMFVGGEWVNAASGASMETIDPTTETTIATVPLGGTEDVDRAVTAAAGAQREWGELTWQQRAGVLREVAQRLADNADEFAELDAIDGGIPVTGMKKDVQNGVDFLLYFAGLASELKGTTLESPSGVNFTLREPYGVVGRIIPFNHPIQFAAAAVAGPLAAGNTVVLKPSDATPISALRFAELIADLLPVGAVNVVTGDGQATGAAIVSHPLIPRIAFTGSVATGRAVLRGAAEHIKSVTLELGGKNPQIIFPDVDIERAALATVDAMNFRRGQGQSCGSPSRVYVHASIHDAYVEQLKMLVEAMVVGDPLERETDMGPLAYKAHYERVVSLSNPLLPRERGSSRAVADRPRSSAAISSSQRSSIGSTPSMKIACEEIFGPVVSILPGPTRRTCWPRPTSLSVGLTANIWTNDLTVALRFSHAIEAGYVWVNGRGQRPFGAPFGGYKHSGLGKENDLEELLSYTKVKNVNISGL